MEDKNEYLINTENIKVRTDLVVKIVIIGVVLWIIMKLFIGYFGNNEIGSFFEKSSYTAQYWVYLQPENTQSKNYRLKADIHHYVEPGDEDYSGGDRYVLEKVYWENGGHSDFDDCEISDSILSKNDKNNYTNCLDNNHNYYKIRLDEKVNEK